MKQLQAMHQPIKIFIGSSVDKDLDAELVLEYTLRKNSSQPLEIQVLKPRGDLSGFFINTTTPFTNLRWCIPELCNFKGKAIYMDSDIFNLRDISELWNTDMDDKAILGIRSKVKRNNGIYEYSVSLLDCEKLQKYLDPIVDMKRTANNDYLIHKKLEKSNDVGILDPRWNSMDLYPFDIKDAWNIHFTNINSQPWKQGCHPHARQELVDMWKELLLIAKSNVH